MSSTTIVTTETEEEGAPPPSSSAKGKEESTSSSSFSSSTTSMMSSSSSSSSSPSAEAAAAGTITTTTTTTTAAATTTATAAAMNSSSSSTSKSKSKSKSSSSSKDNHNHNMKNNNKKKTKTTSTTTKTCSNNSSYFPINKDSPVFDTSKAEQLVKYGCKKVRRSGVIQTFKLSKQPQHIVLKHSDLILDECIGKGSFSSCYTIKSIRMPTYKKKNANAKTPEEQEQPQPEQPEQPLQPLDSSKVVVKVLRRKAMNDPKMFATCAGDLFKEALMLSTLNHCNVISVKAFAHSGIMAYKCGRHDAFFIVLERLHETLSKRIHYWQDQRNSLTFKLPSLEKSAKKLTILKDKTTTILQLANAIQYIHSQGIIHRDIKPDNIGYDLEGKLKVFDFDVARIIPSSTSTSTSTTSTRTQVSKASDSETSEESEASSAEGLTAAQQQQPTSSSSLTQALNSHEEEDDEDPAVSRFNPDETFKLTQRIGSSRYMSPEVASGQEYNQKSDVYTFALLVHEILTLERPYEDIWSGYHEESVFIDGERPWINKKSWTKELIRIVTSCWSQDIYLRPTMKEAYEQLQDEIPNYIQFKIKKNKSIWLKLLTRRRNKKALSSLSSSSSSSSSNNKKQSKVEILEEVEEETIVFST